MSDKGRGPFYTRRDSELENARQLLVPELSLGKLAFLGVLAFLFSSLEPFALFASIPFTISFLLYGKLKTFALGVVGMALAFLLTQVQLYQGSALGTFPLALIYGYLISRSILKEEHPAQGIFKNGLGVFLLFMGLITTFHFSYDGGLRAFLTPYVEKAATQYYKNVEGVVGVPGEQIRQLEDVIKDPSLVVDPVLNYGTGFIFIGVFLSFWVGTFVALRMAPLWKAFHSYKYNVKSLTSFQMPQEMIFPLIAVLAIAVGNVYELFGPWADVVGFNAILMLGIFYFFQGFGILSELLTYWSFFGFLRSMVIFFTVIMAYHVVALVGVLDMWVNFRRFFKKENDEGDKL